MGTVDALLPYLQFSPVALLGLAVLLLLRGDLVPAKQVERIIAPYLNTIEEQRGTITEQRGTIARLDRVNDALLRGNTTTVQVLGALPEVVGTEGGSNVEGR